MNNNFRIMIVDDDDVMVEVIQSALEDRGFDNCASASNGQEALDMFDHDSNSNPYNVLIIDLNMPEMDGIELLRHIAERQYRGYVIILSGADNALLQAAGELARAHHLTIIDVLKKPVNIEELHQSLKKMANIQPLVNQSSGEFKPVETEELEAAIQLDQFVIHYQPIITIETNEVSCVEALLRWDSPKRGIVLPDSFIPKTEQTKLINPITLWLIEKLADQAAAWKNEGFNFGICFNLSVENLKLLDLPEYIEEQCKRAGIKLDTFTAEVTESRLLDTIEKTIEVIMRLRLKGINIAVDDFGTGYATMDSLNKIPFSQLKIDKSFIKDADKQDKTRAILESTIRLAKSLDISVVAEGVETEQEFNFIRALGADFVQGFYFSKPLPADELIAWLKDRKK